MFVRFATCSAFLFTGCFASMSSVAQSAFVKDYGCADAQTVAIDENAGVFEVSGCDKHARYACSPGYATRHQGQVDTTCSVNTRYAIMSTDGTWQDDWPQTNIATGASLKSAAHDIPCAIGSLTSVDVLTVDGCGQRVTYREVVTETYNAPASPSGFRVTNASKYVLIGKVALQPSTVASQDDIAPMPYTAEQIHAASPAGRVITWRIESAGKSTVLRTLRFVTANDEGADIETRDGDAAPEKKHATWIELRGHAAFPRAATTIEDGFAETPAGKFASKIYTVKKGEELTKFFFANDRPGPPVLFFTERDGVRVQTSTLVPNAL